MSQTRRAQVAAAVKVIRAFHELGRSLPAKESHRNGYGRGTVAAEAERHGLNPDTVRKARQFADPIGGYTPGEVNDLCRLITTVQSGQDDGYALFGRTHLIRLLSVKKHRRAAVKEAAVRGGWSTGRLEAEIAAQVREPPGRRAEAAAPDRRARPPDPS